MARVTEYATRWMNLSIEAKTKIKNDALLTLGSSSQKAGAFASQVVAAIATVELPQGHWGDLIEILLGFMNTQANVNLRIATLQTIGFICESIVRLNTNLSIQQCSSYSPETRNSDPPFERDSYCGYPRGAQGRTISRGPVGRDPRSFQLSRVCARQL
jgi:hypothetical protein